MTAGRERSQEMCSLTARNAHAGLGVNFSVSHRLPGVGKSHDQKWQLTLDMDQRTRSDTGTSIHGAN